MIASLHQGEHCDRVRCEEKYIAKNKFSCCSAHSSSRLRVFSFVWFFLLTALRVMRRKMCEIIIKYKRDIVKFSCWIAKDIDCSLDVCWCMCGDDVILTLIRFTSLSYLYICGVCDGRQTSNDTRRSHLDVHANHLISVNLTVEDEWAMSRRLLRIFVTSCSRAPRLYRLKCLRGRVNESREEEERETQQNSNFFFQLYVCEHTTQSERESLLTNEFN